MSDVRNASSEEQVKKAGRKEKDRDRQADLDLLSLMGQPAGRRFIWGILSECGIYRTSMADGTAIYFNEGMRNVGLRLLERVTKAAPSEYLLMIKDQLRETNDE